MTRESHAVVRICKASAYRQARASIAVCGQKRKFAEGAWSTCNRSFLEAAK